MSIKSQITKIQQWRTGGVDHVQAVTFDCTLNCKDRQS